MRSVAKRLIKFRKRPMTVRRLGVEWRLYPRDWIDNRLIIGRNFEYDQLNYVFSEIERRGSDLFIDCGANIGLYSVLIGRHALTIRDIIAFEPVPATFARLNDHISRNDLKNKVTCVQSALSDTSGTAEIQFMKQSSGVASIDDPSLTRPGRAFDERLTISTNTFDNLFDIDGRRAFVKIDVEGHSLPLLRGMQQFLSRNTCLLQIETSNDAVEIQKHLEALGYRRCHAINEDHYYCNETRDSG